jgi:hypothetical protein
VTDITGEEFGERVKQHLRECAYGSDDPTYTDALTYIGELEEAIADLKSRRAELAARLNKLPIGEHSYTTLPIKLRLDLLAYLQGEP